MCATDNNGNLGTKEHSSSEWGNTMIAGNNSKIPTVADRGTLVALLCPTEVAGRGCPCRRVRMKWRAWRMIKHKREYLPSMFSSRNSAVIPAITSALTARKMDEQHVRAGEKSIKYFFTFALFHMAYYWRYSTRKYNLLCSMPWIPKVTKSSPDLQQ